ncbi:DUF2169 family type VI secretion system accessory protein [Enhygromyxa salina]|uniref:DUF2169 domain-containing protein n=1 Tax=Enhygromyxa salina TaxID=215803 RepID=A0A2S9XLI6_9BACT|nr:DUF2169 domain-containing protein [Enhygromyxa salina]PRP93712.1 hypothetical protein ENSA7_81400 [Enhygromyxa salina]
MWALANRTPYAAERNWTRDKDGVHWWLVAVRATFTIAIDGRLTLADEQLPPVLVPEHYGEAGKSSLRYDSDLLARKPLTDVLVLGSAHAPGGRQAPTVPATLRVEAIEKTVIVHGERAYYAGLTGLTATAPRPFTSMPIRYELAFGGSDMSDPDPRRHRIDERNPIGRGFANRSASLENTAAHNIEYPRGNPATTGPAGFGPIEPGWVPRRTLAGTYDAAWDRTKRPLLPNDYDPAFALCAPADQRLAQPLRGSERLGLLNLSREGTLQLELPRIHLELTSRFGRKSRAHEPPMISTVLVEPDDRRLSLVWQSALRVAALDADYLDETSIVEKRGGA